MPTVPTDPVATYRVQLTPEFTFAEVVGILDHLTALGVSHLHLSPILAAMPGSTHGYDWCPPARISPVLGGPEGYRLLRELARAAGIGIILDIVPNHIGVADARRNEWWADVLRYGAASEYAGFFDLDTVGADGLLCLPWLGSDGDLSGLVLDGDGCLLLGDRVLVTAPGSSSPGDDPLAVLARQHYRLVPFDSRLIGYRRFLAVNDLAALRQDAPEVYDATHAWLRELAADDLFDGVRVDHLDGLTDPVGYCDRLRTDIGDRLLYVEKGLGPGERIDPVLPVDGTTGYEQLRIIEAAFTAASGVIELSETHHLVTGVVGDGDELTAVANDLRHVTLIDMFPDRVRRTTRLLEEAAPELPAHHLHQAVTALICEARIARMDYPSALPAALATLDRLKRRNPDRTEAFDVLAHAFQDATFAPGAAQRLAEAVSAINAKAFEDIGYHRTARLVSVQEIGCSPGVPSVTRDVFHRHNAERARDLPRGLSALSTHDTKRSEDVRARIALIAQSPQRWSILVFTLLRMLPPPDAMTGYFLLQNLIGVWPAGDDGATGKPSAALSARLRDYARKAMREGGTVSSWTAVDDDAEAAVIEWLDAVQTGAQAALIADFVAGIAPSSRDEALSRKALSLLLPGVGEIYQGTQWWDDSLTDPDNRRPVDYSQSPDHPKTALVRAALDLRRRHPRAFGPGGTYRPLRVSGPKATHVLGFARGTHDNPPDVVVLTIRLAHTFRPGVERRDATIDLPIGLWRDSETGRDHAETATAAELLGDRPVVFLERL
ncbi:malto-oligosyltrehalose synthase [Gordonia zhaorongruii]|uniref:malto-oligosyltrehalose synthase n=1 Tax=Gordonia zhaorongruii TaxID=2597659 RepID=UPI00117C3388|nr:malto-oligosyltrehalose synthase [Gordonia zhaorongruii]